MMIAYKPDVTVTGVDSLNVHSMDICLRFNTGHKLIAPKPILGTIYMLNGSPINGHMASVAEARVDIDPRQVLEKFLGWGIVYEPSKGLMDSYIQAKGMLCKYTVHFPLMSNVGVMTAVILHKMQVSSIFYENSSINREDTESNIYYTPEDIGKDVIAFLREELCIDTIHLSSSAFDLGLMNESKDIVFNTNKTSWANADPCTTINAWNYHNICFADFKLFNMKLMEISDNLRPLVNQVILACRCIDDMIYSCNNLVC